MTLSLSLSEKKKKKKKFDNIWFTWNAIMNSLIHDCTIKISDWKQTQWSTENFHWITYFLNE